MKIYLSNCVFENLCLHHELGCLNICVLYVQYSLQGSVYKYMYMVHIIYGKIKISSEKCIIWRNGSAPGMNKVLLIYIYLGDNCIQNFHLGRHLVRYMVGYLVLW